ncbi:MAG: hypothetical protein Q9169_003799 [Polycauliona sp. 2 TL-2023]
MASTRQIRIYEDPSAHDIANIFLEPSVPAAHGRSPLKATQTRTTPSKARCGPLRNVPLPPPEEMRSYHLSPTKAPLVNPHHGTIPQVPDTAVFGDLPPSGHYDQENRHPPQHSDNCAAFPGPSYVHASPTLGPVPTNTAPLQGRKSKSCAREPSMTLYLPEPNELPALEDNLGKPNYSYASLIGMSILRAPNRRLQLSQIYKWISETFSYYRVAKDGWKNSIRHNLSIHKEFIKVQRPKDDPGKGAYWTIMPGMEIQFLKEKPSRRPLSSCGPTMKTFSQPLNEPRPIAWAAPDNSTTSKPIEQAFAVSEQPSSDGTIPASDVILHDDSQEDFNPPAPPSSHPPLSPFSAIGSSPPLPLHEDFDDASPPQVSDFFLPPAPPQAKKRKSAAMDDSGYFSCLESSVIKGSAIMESGRPRLKRGRAEEEIARIRSSSYDPSPSKGRLTTDLLISEFASSSPLPTFQSALMPPPPLTPGVKFTQPSNAPTSISPHTHLRNHRSKVSELIDPPLGIMDTLKDGVAPSPVFDFDTDGYDSIALHSEIHAPFSIFADMTQQACSPSLSASPEKRSAQRPRQASSGRTNRALFDVSSNRLNRMMTPLFHAPNLESPIRKGLGNRHLGGQENRLSPVKRDIFSSQWFVEHDQDDDYDENTGFDLTQGFPEIGHGQSPAAKVRKPVRPLFGARSHTSRF